MTLSPCAAHSYRQSGSNISGCPINIVKSAPKSLLQRHDAREYAKDSVDAIMMHYPYIVRQAAGNANHWLMIFFRHIRDANRHFTANTLAINPPFSRHHQRTVVDMLLQVQCRRDNFDPAA